MKKIFKNLGLLTCAVALSFNFAACGGDSDSDNDSDTNGLYIEKDNAKYTVTISDLDDSHATLSYSIKYEYITPEKYTIEQLYSYKYLSTEEDESEENTENNTANTDSTIIVNIDSTFNANSDSTAKSATIDPEKESLPITEAKLVINCSSSDYAQKIYNEIEKDSTQYTIQLDDKQIVYNYTDEFLRGLTYGAVVDIYNKQKGGLETDAQETAAKLSDTTIVNTDSTKQTVVIDSSNSVIINGVLFKVNNGFYSLTNNGDTATTITLQFQNYTASRSVRKPNTLTISTILNKVITKFDEITTLENVNFEFAGSVTSPESFKVSGTADVQITKNDSNTVKITNVKSDNIDIQSFIFNFSNKLTELVQENKNEENNESENKNKGGAGSVSKNNISIDKSTATMTIKTDFYTMTYTTEFSGDKCTKCTQTQVFKTEEYAKRVYESYGNEKSKYTLNGDTITRDVTNEYKGLSKDKINTAFEELSKAYQS